MASLLDHYKYINRSFLSVYFQEKAVISPDIKVLVIMKVRELIRVSYIDIINQSFS